MLNIRRNVIFSLIEVCTSTLLTFISYRVVVMQGGIALLGIWSTLMAWLGLARMGDFGLGGATTRFVSPLDPAIEGARVRAYIDTAILSNFALISSLCLISYAIVSHWLTGVVGVANLAVAGPALPWVVGAIIASNLCMVINSTLFALHKGFIRSIIMITGNLVQLLCVIVLVPRYGLVGFAIAQIVQFSLGAVAAWVAVCMTLGKLRLPLAFRPSVLREMLAISLKLQFATILNTFFEPLSKMLISHFAGMRVQGLYEAAYRAVTIARNLSSNSATATVPAMARLIHSDLAEAQRLYRVTCRNIARGLFLVFGGLVLASPVISLLWFKSMQMQFVVFVALLSVGNLVGGWCSPAYNLGQATGNMRGVIIAMGSSVILLAVGGLAMGLLGYPLAIVAMVSCSVVVSNLLV
ncbi:MAG TPA: oligosaccharide flippase family protein, partial [Novosphingobium sp.]|nr:oligosaccharide flippase family protein [Novosphingobium sp.]